MQVETRARSAPRASRRAAERREAITGYSLLAPALFGVSAFLLVPIGVLADPGDIEPTRAALTRVRHDRAVDDEALGGPW